MTILKNEIDTDPLDRGYSGMSDTQIVESLNTANRTVPVATVSAPDIFEALNLTEFTALSVGDQARVDRILSLGDSIQIRESNARTELLAVFGAGTTTRTNLGALQTRLVSRAGELGLQRVKPGHVEEARG